MVLAKLSCRHDLNARENGLLRKWVVEIWSTIPTHFPVLLLRLKEDTSIHDLILNCFHLNFYKMKKKKRNSGEEDKCMFC